MESIVKTLGEVADALKVSQLTVRRLWAAGKFPPPVNVGRVIRWRETDVREWLANQATSTRYENQKVEQ